jgi:heat-inducible transcriptional repressor
MADLEEGGYIEQPHTSAGRIPTDAGYRVYVDQMMQERDMEVEEMRQEREGLLERVDRMEVMLKQVAKVLAYNTNYATMITAPQYQEIRVKFLQLSMVDESHILAVIVLDGNIIKNQMISVDEPMANEDILKLGVLMNSFLQGASLSDINIEMIQTMKVQAGIYASVLDQILNGVVEAVKSADERQIYTSGATNILKYPEIGDEEKTSVLLEAFEEKEMLNELADETLNHDGKGIQIYIGDEAPVKNMKDLSVVTATYELQEGAKGTIGIIGPKRMDYKKVVSTLKELTIELDEIFNKKE